MNSVSRLKAASFFTFALLVIGTFLDDSVFASSHSEAPLTSKDPGADNTDVYAFRNYEAGREEYAVIIANYQASQDAFRGPNYFPLDPAVRYNIHVDNNGDAVEDKTFRFRFTNRIKNFSFTFNQVVVPIPFINTGPIFPGNDANQNTSEEYTVDLVEGDSFLASANIRPITLTSEGSPVFAKPIDNIGIKSIPNYQTYAQSFVYNVTYPGGAQGRLFVGQRKDPFVVNLGEIFDLVNVTSLVGPANAKRNDFENKNVTSLILEIPITYLTNGTESVIGVWSTADRPVLSAGADLTGDGVVDHKDLLVMANNFGIRSITETVSFRSVSRLGNPLVNELLIGLPDKDKYNKSRPKDDAQFQKYVEYPILPLHLFFLFGAEAPSIIPREDMVNFFYRGLPGLNQPQAGASADIIRLNTSTPPTAANQQNPLGFLGGDNAGWPNGRRIGDDVADIALRVAMGALLPPGQAPSGQQPFTDGAYIDASAFDSTFPYLKVPLPGSPQPDPCP